MRLRVNPDIFINFYQIRDQPAFFHISREVIARVKREFLRKWFNHRRLGSLFEYHFISRKGLRIRYYCNIKHQGMVYFVSFDTFLDHPEKAPTGIDVKLKQIYRES